MSLPNRKIKCLPMTDSSYVSNLLCSLHLCLTMAFNDLVDITGTSKSKYSSREKSFRGFVQHDKLADHVRAPGREDNFNDLHTSVTPGLSLLNRVEKPRHHICRTCARAFYRLEHLSRHTLSHTKEKPFQCEDCGRCFARRDLVLRHQRKVHVSAAPAFGPRNERHFNLTETMSDRGLQSATSQSNDTFWASEGAVSSDRGVTASDTTESSVLAPRTTYAARDKPSNSHDAMLNNFLDGKSYDSLGTTSTLRAPKTPTGLDFLQGVDQGTTSSSREAENHLDYLFADTCPPFGSPHHQSYGPSRPWIERDITFPHHGGIYGNFTNGNAISDAGNFRWIDNGHTGVIATETGEQTNDKLYPLAIGDITAGHYGEGFLEISNNDTQPSHEVKQRTLTLEAQTGIFYPL